MRARVLVTTTTVPIGDVKPHPQNPRRGNVDLIKTSLEQHGQYRPIVAQRSTGHIVAGNHTWHAAKALKWASVAVTWLDVDDETALRVLIADNRTSDLATYNNDALVNLLKSLPSLDGTGFDRYDLDVLENVFGGVSGGEGGATKNPTTKPDIHIGTYDMWIDADALSKWLPSVQQETKVATARHLRAILEFPPPEVKTPVDRKADQTIHTEGELVDIDTLEPFEGNAREGDIGAISESLKHLGQYRPIVVNRPTKQILVGNHTWRAAKHLDWKQIAVTWLEVDDDTAKRIVLIDNRTSDTATYDDGTLIALLTSINLEGTAFTPEDVNDLLNDINTGRAHRNPAKMSAVQCRVADWSWKVDRPAFDEWVTDPDMNGIIIKRLGLPKNCWTATQPS